MSFLFLQDSWSEIQLHINGILWDTFVSIFSQHPSLKDRFDFLHGCDIESLRKFNQEAEGCSNGGHHTVVAGKTIFPIFFKMSRRDIIFCN